MNVAFRDSHCTIYQGDCRDILPNLPESSVQCVVTSPPYWGLRDYGVRGQIGLEESLSEYIDGMVAVFRGVRRVLRDDGTLWLNMGDSYAAGGKGGGGSFMDERKGAAWNARSKLNGWRSPPDGFKPKDLCGVPWRLAFALQDDGWYLRSDIIWAKPNPMPESVTDRPTKSHEYLFLLTKAPRYFYDADAVRTKSDRGGEICGTGPKSLSRGQARGMGVQASGNGKDGGYVISPAMANLRTVWTIPTEPYPGSHFATFPRKLVEPCILAGTSEVGACPECGSPWRRVVELGAITSTGGSDHGRRTPNNSSVNLGRGDSNTGKFEARSHVSVGHDPTCNHPHAESDAVPCTVLDPFAGSGTVGEVARKNGCRFIGIEINPEYCKLAARRLEQRMLL